MPYPRHLLNYIIIFFTSTLSLLSVKLFAQDEIDSLKNLIKSAKHDTSRISYYAQITEICNSEDIPIYANPIIEIAEGCIKKHPNNNEVRITCLKYLSIAYNNLGFHTHEQAGYEKALEYYDKAIKISLSNKYPNGKLVDPGGIGSGYNNMAYVYMHLGDVHKALEYYQMGYDVNIVCGDKLSAANSINGMSNIYKEMGDISKALDYQLRSLKIFERELANSEDKSKMSSCYNNLAGIYRNQGNFQKAIEYYDKALKGLEKSNAYNSIATILSNKGIVFSEMGDINKSLEFYLRAMKMFEDVNDRAGLALTFNNVGAAYRDKGNLKKAEEYFLKGLRLSEETKELTNKVLSLTNLSNLLYLQKHYKEAVPYAELALKLGQESKNLDYTDRASNVLNKVYFALGKYKEAYQMHVLHKQLSDSLVREFNKKESLQKGFQYESDKRAATDSIKSVEQKVIFSAKMEQEKTRRVALYVGLGLVLVFAGFMYNRFRITQKQKHIIELQKVRVDEAYEELHQQTEEISAQRDLIEEQKHVVEEKQKEIIDSIHYASRIQRAMLTSEEYISKHFNAEYFIYYQPKDIVSGDFYWAVQHHDKFYMATADCTGHGVPGAFMSLLNIGFLNENVIEFGLSEPAQILNSQRKQIIHALNPKGDENSKDGMDCVLCAFDFKNMKLDFAAANNPVWLLRDNALEEFKADKMPVGKYDENAKDFRSQSIELKKGDVVYTFTDGYADQFGGPKGKKFKYKQLEEVLLANHHLPMNAQKEILQSIINNWRGDAEQVDDILVIGVKV